MAGTQTTPGSTHFAGKALRGYAAAIAAEYLATDAKHVDVTLSDDAGLLGVRVAAPIGLAARSGTATATATATGTGTGTGTGTSTSTSIVERVGAARAELRSRMQQLTGRTVGRVDVVVTRRTLRAEPRVK